MMIHHSDVPYNEAATAAATHGRQRLMAMIEQGRVKGRALVTHVQDQIIDDRVMSGTKLNFEPSEAGVRMIYGDGNMIQAGDRTYPGKERVHKHAMNQIAAAYKIPMPYVNTLLANEDFGHDLLAKILSEHAHWDPERRLIRSVKGEARGFLSSKYRRIDPAPVLAAFLEACDRFGALPFESYIGETKFEIKVILGRIFEPVENEVVAFGMSYSASQFGAGAEQLSHFIDRIWCTNLASIQTPLRKVHVGTRLTEDMEWSEELLEKETQAMSLMVRDVTNNQLGAPTINKLVNAIKIADETKLKSSEVEAFVKKYLSTTEADQVTNLYAKEDDIEILPRKASKWRLSNAVSWMAKDVPDGQRRLELEEVAGRLLT